MSSSRVAVKIRSLLIYPLIFFMYIYVVALTSSMAGMELGVAGITLFFVLIALVDRFCNKKIIEWHLVGAEFPMIAFVVIAALGLFINAPDADTVYALGSLRTFAFFFVLVFAFQITKNLNNLFSVLIVCSVIVATYAIWQHYTGIDLWRHNHRALVDLPLGDRSLYQSVGFFSHHLTYGHSFMMILCLPWTAVLLSSNFEWWKKLLAALVFIILLVSVVFTYGRGVWIAIAMTLPLMALFVSRKLLVSALLVLAVVGGVVLKFNPMIRERTMTIFSDNYTSNEERKKLWRANMAMFHDHPWIGVGYKQNETLTTTYYERLGIKDGISGHSHSNYVELLATTGILGFACYMLLILSFILLTARLYTSIPRTHYWHKVIVLAALGAQISFHIGGLTQWNFGDAEVQHQFLFWLAVIAYMSRRYYAHIVPDDHSL